MTELLFRDDAYLPSCAARVIAADERGIRLDRTVFYPTGGGQPGDTGSLRLASGETVAIVDAVKGDGARRGHPCAGAGQRRAAARHRGRRRDRLGPAAPADAHAQLPAPAVRGRAGGGDRRAGVRRPRPARFRRARVEPRQGGDRRPPQRVDRGRPPGRRRAGSPTTNSPPGPSWCARCRSSRRPAPAGCG